MNQETIFRFIGSAGLGGGFAVGNKLPKEKGNLKDFKVVRIDAIKNEVIGEFSDRLIIKLGETPKRGNEIKARQLKSLIESFTVKGKKFIAIINKAHLLHQRTLLNLKGIHEWGEGEGTCPGFVLLGNLENINELLKKEDSIRLRTITFPS